MADPEPISLRPQQPVPPRPLPPGWKMSQSEKGVYYWHKDTKRTQWHFPDEEAKAQEKDKRHSYANVLEQGLQQPPQQNGLASGELSQVDYTYDEIGKPSQLPVEGKMNQSASKKPALQASTKQDVTTMPPDLPPPLPQRCYDAEPEASESAPPIPVRRYSPPPVEKVPMVRCNSTGATGSRVSDKGVSKKLSHYSSVVVKAHDDDPEAPPLPERTVESEELLPTGVPEQHALPEDTIAYAIVCCNGDQAEKPAKKPPPMEDPAPAPVTPTDDGAANKKWRTVYEEIDFVDMAGGKKAAPSSAKAEVTEDGKYMEVGSNKAATLRIVQQTASFPLAMWKPTTTSGPLMAPPSSLAIGSKKGSGGLHPSPAVAPKGRSDQSPGDQLGEYDLPLNSRRLISQSSTLTQGDDPSYSKLATERDPMIALRSGVKLRHSSISGSEMLLTPLPDDEVGRAADDHSSNEDIVSKCIRSMQEIATPTASPREEAAPTSRPRGVGSITSPGYKLQKIPDTPPRWMFAKRKPHVYEDVDPKKNMGSGDRSSLCTVSSRSLPDLDNPDLEWDETDLGTADSSSYVQGGGGSASQPNLLDSKLFAGTAQNGVHSSPPSGGGGYSQQRRHKNHRYEDVDLDPPADPTENVNALKRTIRSSLHETKSVAAVEERLPKGWQTMVDEHGVKYYWHVPTGKTQYNKPADQIRKNSASQLTSDATASSKCQTFTTRYVNFLPVQESDLVPGECVKVVHSCITKLLSNRAEASSAIDKGKVVTIQIQDMQMKWLSPESPAPLCVQPINKIRVWGIGLENERDFGYVARDPVTRQHRCHVFRCDNPARAVARALLESHQQEKKGGGGGSTVSLATEDSPSRGHAKLVETKEEPRVDGKERVASTTVKGSNEAGSDVQKLPADTSETCQVFACTYMGSCDVTKPSGMDLLNEAVEQLLLNTSHWLSIQLEVTDSCIKIVELKTKKVLKEHRIRFLSFLGIATNARYCGYIVDLGGKDKGKKFQFYGFKKEPNTDQMCLALHNACQKRYQRVVEASAEMASPQLKPLENIKQQEQLEAGTKTSIFSRRGSSRKSQKLPEPEDTKYSYTVHYFGSLLTNKSEGVEAVTEPLQKLYSSRSGQGTTVLINFEISPQGVTLVDPQKRTFSKKTFDVKFITYVARIRNYFAIVVREGGKFHCHVFMEGEVDSGTLVSTIQKVLAGEGSPQKKSS